MGARVSTDRMRDSLPAYEGMSGGAAAVCKQSSMHEEVVEVRKEGESTEELSVHFGYQCQSSHGASWHHQNINNINGGSAVDADAVAVSVPNGFQTSPRNSSFSSLSGAALGANATLANSSLCNGKLGEEILPGLDPLKTFRKLDSICRTSSHELSTLIGVVPAELGDFSSYAGSFLHARDVQMAGGAAGEDRVQAVCSEDKGWLFCGIYDGFNGRDAADFLAGTLYGNVGLHLRLLEHEAQKRHSLQDGDDDDVMVEGNMDTTVMDDDDDDLTERDGAAWSPSEDSVSSDLPQFRRGVLDGLRQALFQTESDFLGKVEQEMQNRPDLVMVGSCVLVVLMYGRSLYTLNLGDSRAVLATSKAPNSSVMRPSLLCAVELTKRHVVEDAEERERVMNEHPEDPRAISNGRLKGKLRVTRAFGAGYLKKAIMNNALMGILRVKDLSSPPYLTITPSVSRLEVQPEDKFVVIGSDGLFDFFTNEEVVDYINKFLTAHPAGDPAKYMVDQLLIRAAHNAGIPVDQLKSIPIGRRRKFHDDVTIIVVDLRTEFSSKASTFS